ncbi:hypothetical protein [Williamsia sp. R60]
MGIHGNVTSDRSLTTMFLVVMVALGGPAFIGTAASDGSPWDWFLLTVWVCTVLGAAWSTRRAWRARHTPDVALETYPALGLTEGKQLSTSWLRTVWLSSLFLATLAGGYVGAVTSTTVVGAVVGAMMAVPAGAIAALIIVGTGALFLRASGGGERRASRDRWFRVVFSVYVGTVVGLLLFIVSFVLAAGDLAQVPYVGIVCVTALVAAMGFRFPPTYRTAGR